MSPVMIQYVATLEYSLQHTDRWQKLKIQTIYIANISINTSYKEACVYIKKDTKYG